MKTTLRKSFICILFLLSWHLVDAQISVLEINNDCQANCTGGITWKLVVKQSPVLVTLFKDGQVYKAPRTFNPGQHTIPDKELCKGTYTLQVYPKGFASCGISSEPVKITEESFDFDIYKVQRGFNTRIELKFSQPGVYTSSFSKNAAGPFLWGLGRSYVDVPHDVLQENEGVIFIRVRNGNNCEVIKRFKLSCFEHFSANFEIEPIAGDPDKIKLKALVFDENFLAIDLNQEHFAIAWWSEKSRTTLIGSGNEIIIQKSILPLINGVRYVTLEVTNMCRVGATVGGIEEKVSDRQVVTKVVDCLENDNSALAFITKITPFCLFGNRGSISFSRDLDFMSIKVDGHTIPPSTDAKVAKNLSSGPHTIEIGGCSVFVVNVPEDKSEMKFSRLNKVNNEPSTCVYNTKCGTDKIEFTNEFPVKLDENTVNTTFCSAQTYCDYDGFRRDFGVKSFGAEKTIAAIYTRILQGEIATTTNGARRTFLQGELDRVKGVPGCAIVKYCPTTFERISTDGASLAQNPGISCDGDCEFLDCTFFFGTAGKIHDACAEAPNYMADTRNCCGPGGKRVDIPLGQLAYTYFSLSPEELEQLYLTVPQFEDSQLEKTLKTHIAPLFDGLSPSNFIEAFTRDPRLACAHAFVCTDDFKLVDVGDQADVPVPNLLNGVEDCGEDVLALPWSITESEGKDKHASKKTTTCALHPDFINTRPFRVQTSSSLSYLDESDGKQLKGVFTCGATIYKPFIGKKRLVGDDNVEIWSGIGLFSQLIPSDPFTQPENRFVSSFSEEEPTFQQKGWSPRFKIITDTVSTQSILRFTTIKASGQFVPKLMFEEAGENKYYNYSHNIPVIEKIDMKNVEFLYEDWDDDKTFALLKSIPQKEYIISAQDTSRIIALAISSDSLLKVSHFSKAENSIFIGGYYYGKLFVGGEVFDSIPDYQKASAFLGRISLQGDIQDLTIIENIDTVGGLLFSENQAAATIVATQVIGNKLRINGQDSTLLSENCLVIGKYDLNGFQMLNQSSGHTGFKIAAVSASSDNQEFAVATFGTGAITQVNDRPVLSSGHNLNIMRFNGQGDYVDAIVCASNNVNTKKIGLTYGSENALALGITYKNTIQIFDTTLTSLGQEDVAILKFSSEGNVRWIKDYGSEDQESLSQLFYNKNNVIYFAGEMSGATAETRRLGEYIFYDTTSLANQRVYLSYVRDTLFTSNIPEIATEINPQISNKKLTSRSYVQALNVQPNPFTDQTTVIYTTTEAGHYTLAVQNELGRVIMQQSWELNVGQQSHVLSTPQLTPGFYYLTLRNANGKIVGAQKLIKQ